MMKHTLSKTEIPAPESYCVSLVVRYWPYSFLESNQSIANEIYIHEIDELHMPLSKM